MDLACTEEHKIVEYIPFNAIDPFTITLVGSLNHGELNLKEVFHQLPITETNFKAKEGKKVKINVIAHSGAIIAAKYKVDGVLKVRGIDKKTRAFNNCISMVVTVSNKAGVAEKNIDFKLFKDQIHTTGSRTLEHTIESWSYLKTYLLEMTNISTTPVKDLNIVNLRYKMIDKSFDLGFKISRENLKGAIDKVNGFHVIWESGVHSNGVSVKYPLEPFDGPLEKKKKKMPPCISLIVFTTGKVIISGNDPVVMEKIFDLFHKTVYAIRDRIELKIKQR
jgi:hypothetical protein